MKYGARARVALAERDDGIVITIADDGPGFDVSSLPDPTDPENLIRPSGRGILFMRMFMDDVRYNATGNRVTLVKNREERAADEAPSAAA